MMNVLQKAQKMPGLIAASVSDDYVIIPACSWRLRDTLARLAFSGMQEMLAR